MHKSALPLLMNLARDEPVTKSLRFTHPDHKNVYASAMQDIFLMSQLAGRFVKESYKHPAHYANSFY